MWGLPGIHDRSSNRIFFDGAQRFASVETNRPIGGIAVGRVDAWADNGAFGRHSEKDRIQPKRRSNCGQSRRPACPGQKLAGRAPCGPSARPSTPRSAQVLPVGPDKPCKGLAGLFTGQWGVDGYPNSSIHPYGSHLHHQCRFVPGLASGECDTEPGSGIDR